MAWLQIVVNSELAGRHCFFAKYTKYVYEVVGRRGNLWAMLCNLSASLQAPDWLIPCLISLPYFLCSVKTSLEELKCHRGKIKFLIELPLRLQQPKKSVLLVYAS